MQYTYNQYCEDLNVVETTLLTEGFAGTLTGVPRNLAGFIQPLRDYFPNISIKDTIRAFKNTKVFGILKSFGFSLAKIGKSIHKGLSLIDNGILKVFKELGKTKALQKIKSGVMTVDDIINKYPILNRVTGVAVAGILLFIWLNMSFSGNFDGDMDLSGMFRALAGDFSLQELFGSAMGAKMLALLSLGITTGGTVSFPWLMKSSINLAMALTYSFYKMAKVGTINIEEIKKRIKRKKLKEGLTMNFKEEMLNEAYKKQNIARTVRTIEQLTDNNAHIEALLFLAKQLNSSMYIQVLEAMEKINLAYGHTPSEIIKMRDGKGGVRDDLMKLAKKQYSKEDFKLINGAF